VFSFDQIKDLIELVAQRHLQGIEVESGEFRLKIDGHRVVMTEVAAGAIAPEIVVPVSTVAAGEEAEGSEGGIPDGAHVITSPIVGTFYTAPSPDSPAYVQVGDRVKAGQVLCIVEAMKLMNEIESDVDGEILEIIPANAQAVEFGEPLFALRAV
jgi:acetyl-CoA carboxylase biotin carboxyl carrier protein